MGEWHVYTATGGMCPPVVGTKPAHLDFVLQLSQPMCDHTPMCEQTEFVLLGDPQLQRCKTPTCVQNITANSFHGRTSLTYLCRSCICTGYLSIGLIIQLHWDPAS